MNRVKRLMCLLLAMITIVSLCTVGFTAQAAVTDTAEVSVAYPTAADDFTWDNATVYFLLTDRFNNGNTSNDHSYNRGLNQNGSVASINNVAAFQGGDFKGITQKINEGYFDDLGINAIWVAGWFEQVHGYVVGGDGKKSFPHYSYHGYYGLDFTELDKNFGTEAEFKEMIDTAHKHGIRIVLDVVLNHPGYNSIYDMNEYNFGTLQSGWQDVYYNYNSINQTNYHGKIGYNDNATNWGRWWGSNWIRAGLAGYENNGSGSELTESVSYLPDFKTESGSTVNLPEILKTKWNKEGTYSAKVSEIDQTFKNYNLGNKTVSNYLISWYTKWVEEYGIDGFRCDTAKHVGQDVWKRLSIACTKALENWRKANPNAVGADWDEEFWMTGEHFGQGVSNNSYYQNGFDSMINFSFSADNKGNGANGMKKASNLNNTYADYANQINNNPNFNVLTYISSHDTGLCRDDLYYQGSALLLLPGGVQIYYGDETNRSRVDCTIHDHTVRSFMNWNGMDKNVLAHWQKVGQFRNNHVAVGAGSHANLSASSGTAFARTYNKNGVTDKVACVVGANNNSNITITLNNTFANGTVVKNAYDGKTATVENGKVTFNSGAHGTILVEIAEGVTPTQPTTAKPTEAPTQPTTAKPTQPTTTKPVEPSVYVTLGDADLNTIVNIKDATAVQKHAAEIATLAGNSKIAADADESGVVNIKDATAIQKYVAELPAGCRVGEKIKVSGGSDEPVPSNPTTPTIPTTPTTPDPTEAPTDAPSDGTIDLTQIEGQIIILANSTYATPYQHNWTDGGNPHNTWPGEPLMQFGPYYAAIVHDEANMIIFNDNGGAQTENLSIPGEFAIYDMATGSWSGFLSDYFDVTKFPTQGFDVPVGPTPSNPTPSTPEDPSGNYIYFRDAAGWGTAYCHYWSDSSGSVWPGDQMENVGGNLYRIALQNDSTGAMYQKVVFNNGNGTQTSDLMVELGRAFNNQTNQWEDK